MSLAFRLARRPFLAGAVVAWLGASAGVARAAGASLNRPGLVVMLRHALAPGVGDPPGFVLEDCATQRNLDARGRRQARAIGELLRQRGLDGAPVYSSRWCRCLETAEHLALGPVEPLPALDSFFQNRSERDARTAALRAFLAELGAAGPPIVMVTHQVNISAVTGRGTRSGEGVVLQRLPDGGLEEVEALAPPPSPTPPPPK